MNICMDIIKGNVPETPQKQQWNVTRNSKVKNRINPKSDPWVAYSRARRASVRRCFARPTSLCCHHRKRKICNVRGNRWWTVSSVDGEKGGIRRYYRHFKHTGLYLTFKAAMANAANSIASFELLGPLLAAEKAGEGGGM